MEGNKYQLDLLGPAILKLTLGEYTAELDVFESWRLIITFDKEPTVDKKWEKMRQWLATQFVSSKETKESINPTKLAENILVSVWEAIIQAGLAEEKLLKNGVGRMLSSHSPTSPCQEDGNTGLTNSNELT